MKKNCLILLFLLVFNNVFAQYNKSEDYCKEAVKAYDAQFYNKALELFDRCTSNCDWCKRLYAPTINSCEKKSAESQSSEKEILNHNLGKDIHIAVKQHVNIYNLKGVDDGYLKPAGEFDIQQQDTERQDLRKEIAPDTMYLVRYDTLYYTDNKAYLHPFFNKNLKLKKSVWYGTVNGVGGAALVGGIVCGIQAQSNYRKHRDYAADTRQDHRQYYRNYRVCNGLMWGCIGLAVAAFTSNFLAVQVSDEVRISPGVLMDMQGNVQASLSVRF